MRAWCLLPAAASKLQSSHLFYKGIKCLFSCSLSLFCCSLFIYSLQSARIVLEPLLFAGCPHCCPHTRTGCRESICKEPRVIAVCQPHAPAVLCVHPPKQRFAAFDFAWVVVSLMACQQHLILGPAAQSLRSWAEEVVSLAAVMYLYMYRVMLCAVQPHTLAWLCFFSF